MKTLAPLCVGVTAAVLCGFAAPVSVTTLIGTGAPGYSDNQVNNPYGLVIGPDGALYFCDLDNQRVRRQALPFRSPRRCGLGRS
jgi:hypothetical protein